MAETDEKKQTNADKLYSLPLLVDGKSKTRSLMSSQLHYNIWTSGWPKSEGSQKPHLDQVKIQQAIPDACPGVLGETSRQSNLEEKNLRLVSWKKKVNFLFVLSRVVRHCLAFTHEQNVVIAEGKGKTFHVSSQ